MRATGRWTRWIIVSLVIAFLVAEVVLRLAFGLGNPPRMRSDSKIEYLYTPSQDLVRFGNRIRYNGFGMRGEDFPRRRSDAAELRVIAIGDSVLNGGAQTDQEDIATEILRRELPRELNRPVSVGNISAGSWGPPNALAFVEAFGLFDADVVILVWSSHDYADVPTSQPIERRPLLATEEALTRYLPRFLPAGPTTATPTPSPQDIDTSLSALAKLVALSRVAGAHVIVAQHMEKGELSSAPDRGHDHIRRTVEEAGATVIQLGPDFATSLKAGRDPYRDSIHPNEVGQRLLADALKLPLIARFKRDDAVRQE
ncbi:MAG: GDSL-type esterase/lipase family protein [Tepidisphaeraceae bacterium]